jgi:hypothetical protein
MNKQPNAAPKSGVVGAFSFPEVHCVARSMQRRHGESVWCLEMYVAVFGKVISSSRLTGDI